MNRQIAKNIFHILSKPLPLKWLRSCSNENFIFPFYHLVSNSTPLHIKHLYPVVSEQLFLSDLEYLLKHYNPVTINDVVDFISNDKKSDKPRFFLSFDDGMRECYDVIYPILKKKGIQAAFFINPAFVDNKELFFKHKISMIIEKLQNTKDRSDFTKVGEVLNISNADNDFLARSIKQLEYKNLEQINKIGDICKIDFPQYLKEQQPFMTLQQIKELKREGFTIGSHSYDHPEFRKIDDQQMKLQISQSLEYLFSTINPEIKIFAFPFTDFEIPASFFNYLHNEAGFDITFGTAGIKRDREMKHIQRIPMEDGTKNGKRIIRSEYAYFWVKSLFGKNTITRKR